MESNLLMLSEPSLLCLNDPILSCLLNSPRILSLSQVLVNHRSGYRTLAEQKNTGVGIELLQNKRTQEWV